MIPITFGSDLMSLIYTVSKLGVIFFGTPCIGGAISAIDGGAIQCGGARSKSETSSCVIFLNISATYLPMSTIERWFLLLPRTQFTFGHNLRKRNRKPIALRVGSRRCDFYYTPCRSNREPRVIGITGADVIFTQSEE